MTDRKSPRLRQHGTIPVPPGPSREIPDGLKRLLDKIYRERGVDFREYRASTLTRRVGRRIRFRGLKTYTEYDTLLNQDPDEYARLFNDLTINVTQFLRDRGAFKTLEKVVFPEILKDIQSREGKVRIWSAGCATGAEPYSIAMLLKDVLGTDDALNRIRIRGTDLDPKAVGRAKRGIFTPKAVEQTDPAWVKIYFTHIPEGYRVRRVIRKRVDFAIHDLIWNSPLPDMDLIVCRNVLIYFAPDLQVRVLKNLHQSLKPGGFLFLGKAEIPTGDAGELFDCIEQTAHLFQKRG